MDANRSILASSLAVMLALFGVATPVFAQQVLGQSFVVETTHFRVMGQDPEFTKQVAAMAEAYRSHLAKHWLGHELPDWGNKVPLVVQTRPNMPASGETKYTLMAGGIHSIQMLVCGTRERILDSVLPHELTHTVLATHFAPTGKPVPRWADEGACTTVEHTSERHKHDIMLVKFLTDGQGIPFSHLFAMREYPEQIMPLYSQGYSLCAFLVAQAGPRKFVEFLERGMLGEDWVGAVASVYGYPKLGSLQTAWNAWVYDGGGDVQGYTAVALGLAPRGLGELASNNIQPVSAPSNPSSKPTQPILIRASQPAPAQTMGGAIQR